MKKNHDFQGPPQRQASNGIQQKLQQGLALHQRGMLSDARTIYEDIIRQRPDHFDALHLLGVIAYQTKNLRQAEELIGKAIKVNPNVAIAYSSRGNALKDLKRLDEALASYDKAIALKPDYDEAYNNRGITLQDLKRFDEAIASYDKAIALKPDAGAYYNRGNILQDLKRFDEAIASYDKAIALKPDYADAYNNRGIGLQTLKRFDEAIASYDKAIVLKPDLAKAWLGRGNLLKDLKRFDEAVASYDKAIVLKPDYANAYNNRGIGLQSLKRFDEALTSYENAIALQPDAGTYYNCGNVLRDLNRINEALASYDKAIALKPDYAEVWVGRGDAFKELKRHDEAFGAYEKAIALKDDFAEAYSNRGVMLKELKQVNAAIANFNKAIAIKPDYTEAIWNKSLALLLLGDFEGGWNLFEWRWEIGFQQSSKRNFPQPLWLGKDSLVEKTILLYCEQGLGDTIQFCRYAKLVAGLGARVILEVPKPLMSVLSNLSGVAQLAEEGSPLPPFDYQCPLMSLPLAFKTNLSNIPANIPYLKANIEKSLFWKEKLGEKNKLRVGLVWSGGFRPNQPEVWSVNKRRNISLAKLAALKSPDVEFYSLQKGQPAESELAELIRDNWNGPHIVDDTNLLGDFSDTAALVENLDLVISVDTSTAHLAGSLGKPVWILNRFDTDWRWLLDRSDSPWYPTAKVYRQENAGDWDDVVQRVKADLISFHLTEH